MDQATVSERLKFHTMPAKVKGFVSKEVLGEFHLQEIAQLSAADTLSPWLTTSQAWEELAQKAVNGRLKSLGWTQKRIAKAKGVSQQWVSDRLKFYSLNDKVKEFTSKGLLPEVLLQEICHLQVTCNLSPWLTTQQAWEALAQDLKIFKMGLLGIPQERIAQRLGISRDMIQDHLWKSSELKKATNELLTKGFATNTIAEKLGWPESHPGAQGLTICNLQIGL